MGQGGLDVVRLDLVLHQATVFGRVAYERRQRQAERKQRKSVEDARNSLSVSLVDELGHQHRGKRQEGDEQEHEQVEPVERGVGST